MAYDLAITGSDGYIHIHHKENGMTEIKSALEIAMAKTQDIKGDKNTLRISELKNDGKRLASDFLDPVSKVDERDISTKLKSLSDADRTPYVDGFFSVMMANLTLPSNETYSEKLKVLEKGVQAVLKDRKQTGYIFEQIQQFFEQYINARDQIEEGVKEQYEPKLREKERMLEQQMGAQVHLTHEQDQEFLALLSKNFSRLDEQYNEALQRVKDQFEQMLGAVR